MVSWDQIALVLAATRSRFHSWFSTYSLRVTLPQRSLSSNNAVMRAISKRCCMPISCAIYQGSCLPAPARSFRTSTINNNTDQTESSQDPPPFSNDAYSNVQINPENKTVTTAVGELPISPLMDPAFHEARQRFTKPKPQRREHKLTKFQRQLARSPYGSAPYPSVFRRNL